jgi:hypothetical protein
MPEARLRAALPALEAASEGGLEPVDQRVVG